MRHRIPPAVPRARAAAAALRLRVARKREVAALMRELGEHVGAAAREPGALEPRPCPVCGDGEPAPEPDVRGPVYAFHRCGGCSLLYAPGVLRHGVTRRLYGERPIYHSYWEHMRRDAEEMQGRDVYRPLVQRLRAATPGRELAIDVGCGFGKLAAELAPHFRRTFGLELNRRTARAGAAMFGVEIRPERLERLRGLDGAADLIVMNQVLEHLIDVRGVMDAAHRLLKPGGALWIGIPHGASAGMRLLGGAHRTVATHVHVNLFTSESLRRLAAGCGFTVRELGTDDQVDVSAADLAVERLPATTGAMWLAPAFALDRALRAVVTRARIPSRLGLGAHLEAILVKP